MIRNTKRAIRMLNIDPEKSHTFKTQNIHFLKSRLSPQQVKKVEFIADKIFELDSLELAYINKKLNQLQEPISKFGLIGFDKLKASRIRGGKLIRNKRRI